MKTRQLFTLIGSLCLLLILTALSSTTICAKETSTSQKVYTLTLCDNALWRPYTEGSFSRKEWFFLRKIEERSKGRLKIDVKLDLFPPTEALYACIDGRIDMAVAPPGYYTGTMPMWFFGGLPFLIGEMQEYYEIMHAPKTRNILDRAYRKAGVVYVSGAHSGEQDAVCSGKRPIATVDDFKGLKMRTFGKVQIDTFRALGASSVDISFAELPTALSLGTVDGFMTGLVAIMTLKLYKMGPFVNRWPICNAYTVDLWINEKKLNALPKDLQKVILDVGKEVEDIQYFGAWAEDLSFEKAISSGDIKGITLTVPAATEIEKAKKITSPVWDEWANKSGPEARDLLNAIKEVLADYRAQKKAK